MQNIDNIKVNGGTVLGKRQFLNIDIGVIAIMILIPMFMQIGKPELSLVFSVYTMYLQLQRKKGTSVLIYAMACCIPVLFSSKQEIIHNDFYWVYYSIRFPIILGFLLTYGRVRKLNFSFLIILGIVMIFLTGRYGSPDYNTWINNIIYLYLFFYICYYDKLDIRYLYLRFIPLIVIYVTYTYIQYLFGYNPYSNIMSFGQMEQGTCGLSGHYIVQSVFLLTFIYLLLLRLRETGKLNFLIMGMIIVAGIMSTSRTFILGFAIEIVIFLILNRSRYKSKFITKILIFAFLLIIGLLLFGTEITDRLLDRFEWNIGHRESAFPTALAIFYAHPYGVGPNQVADMMDIFARGDLIVGFGTFDNLFLTQLASYGVYCFIPLAFYSYYYIYSICKMRTYKNLFYMMSMFFLPWLAVGFSFDIEAYGQILVVTGGMIGYIFMLYHKKLVKQ